MNELTVVLTSTHYARDCKNICGHRHFSSVFRGWLIKKGERVTWTVTTPTFLKSCFLLLNE